MILAFNPEIALLPTSSAHFRLFRSLRPVECRRSRFDYTSFCLPLVANCSIGRNTVVFSSSRCFLIKSQSSTLSIGSHRTALGPLRFQIFVLNHISRRVFLHCFVAFSSIEEGNTRTISSDVQSHGADEDDSGILSIEADVYNKENIFDKPESDNRHESTVYKLDNSIEGDSTPKTSHDFIGLKGASSISSVGRHQMNAVVIVFDIETTGLNSSHDRIIEFAARDLSGGHCSTLQTLVNPEMPVPFNATRIHGIHSDMVNKDGVPRWKEVAPVILHFVECRRASREVAFLVAHNGKKFDVPFLVKEFQRCSLQVPSQWRFVDSVPIARDAMKAKGLKGISLKLTSLHEFYNLPFSGQAHRAVADVDMLAYVLKMLMMDLKMPVSALLERSFTVKDIKSSGTLNDDNLYKDVLQHHNLPNGYKEDEDPSTPWDNAQTNELNYECRSWTTIEDNVYSSNESSTTEDKLRTSIDTVKSSFLSLNLGSDNRFPVNTVKVNGLDVSDLPSLLKKNAEAKHKNPDLLHLWRFLDFYLVWLSLKMLKSFPRYLALALWKSGEGRLQYLHGSVPMASLHNSAIDSCICSLHAAGIHVSKQDQVRNLQHKGLSLHEHENIAQRPVMISTFSRLKENSNDYVMAIVLPSNSKSTWGLAYTDFLSGVIFATEAEGVRLLVEEIYLVHPREIIYSTGVNNVADEVYSHLPPGFLYTPRPSLEFDLTESIMMLEQKMGFNAVDCTKLEELPAATCATAALLQHLNEMETSSRYIHPSCNMSIYSLHDYMLLDRMSRCCFEVFTNRRNDQMEGSLLWALDQTKTNMGKRMLRKWLSRPLFDKDAIHARQNVVELFVNDAELRTQVRCDLSLMNDIQVLANEVACGVSTPWDLLALAQSISVIHQMFSKFEGFSNSYFDTLVKLGKDLIFLANKIQSFLHMDAHSLLENGHVIRDNVDEVLDAFRIETRNLDVHIKDYENAERNRLGLSSLEIKMDDAGEHFFTVNKRDLHNVFLPVDYQRYISNDFQSLESFITDILMENSKKRKHFLKKARLREAELLRHLKEEVCSFLCQIHAAGEAVADIDVLASFAESACLRGYCRPALLENSREITIIEGRHPVVELLLGSNKRFNPNPVNMGYGSGMIHDQHSWEQAHSMIASNSSVCDKSCSRPDILVLSGPPGSGKSCYLRQVGLIQILAQIGSYVPAKKCHLGIADAIYMRTDGGHDLFSGLSSFDLEITEYATILQNVSSHSLVLLDGFGSGNSQEINALTIAMCEYLAETVKARTLLTTKQEKLCALEDDYLNISNFHFTDDDARSLYTIKPGFFLGASSLIKSRLGGVPECVAQRVLELIAPKPSGLEILSLDEGSMQDVQIVNEERKRSGTEETSVIVNSGPKIALEEAEAIQNMASRNIIQFNYLDDLWQKMLQVLQNNPATFALTKQKGILISVQICTETSHVHVATSTLFIKKFLQHEHSAALEAAFLSVLRTPIKLRITTLEEEDIRNNYTS